MRFVRSAALALAAIVTLDACSAAHELEQSAQTSDCARCHGLPPALGAHLVHSVAGTYSRPLACESCHAVPDAFDHANGRLDLELGALAVQGVQDPGYAGAGGTCAVYCHGSTAELGKTSSPPWTSTDPLACGACHSLAPTSGWHAGHLSRGVRCDACHPGFSIDPPRVNFATHVNGTLESSPTTTTATFSAWPSACITCHGTWIQPL